MRRQRRAFTLIELIVVIAILVLLAAIAVPAYAAHVRKAEEAACKQQATALGRAYIAYALLDQVAWEDAQQCFGVLDTVVAELPGSAKEAEGVYSGICKGGTYTAAVDAQGRLSITCSKHGNVLSGDAAATPGGMDVLAMLRQLIEQDPEVRAVLRANTSIDSTSPNGTRTQLFKSKLGIGDAVTWKVYPVSSNSYVLYWTDVDISSVAAGTEVTVLKYGSGSGNYFTGKARVVEHTLDGETYKVLEYQPALIDQQIIEKP